MRARQAEGTRQLLIATARELFTERGFAATSIEEIIQRAGVAKGALYHHFSGKNDLFRAVYDAVQADAVAGVVAAALAESEPWAAVRAGLSAFLDACLDPAFRRVVVLDSVGVLQQDVWDGGIEHNELPMLRTVLTPLVAADLLPGVGVEPLVHVALGGLYGAALFIARSRQPRVARRDVDAVLDALVAGLQSRPGRTDHGRSIDLRSLFGAPRRDRATSGSPMKRNSCSPSIRRRHRSPSRVDPSIGQLRTSLGRPGRGESQIRDRRAPRSTTETVRAQIDAITPSRRFRTVWTTRVRYSGLMFGFIRNVFTGS